MKKIAKYLFAAVAMIAATSCAKELVDDLKPELQLQGKAYVFKGTLETPTKTVLDQNSMMSLWDVDEAIAVIEAVDGVTSVNKYVAKGLTAPSVTATFEMAEGYPGLVGKSAYAVSPYNENHACLTDAAGLSVVYKADQVAVANSYDPEGPVAVAYNADVEADQNFKFQNVSALLKLMIDPSSAAVENVAVYSLAGEPISGAMVLTEETVDGDKKWTISGAEEGALDKVALTGAEGKALETGVTYYIAVAPAVLEGGIGIRLNNDEKQTYTISKQITLERGKIYDLGVFQYVTPAEEDWYLIGDFTAGNANSVKKTQLVKLDEYFYGASNVSISEGQSFKIYNPAKKESYYVAGDVVKAKTLAPLTNEDGFGTFGVSGVYDIYVSFYSDWNEDWTELLFQNFVNVYLVPVNADTSSYPTPDGLQFTWLDYEYGDEGALTVMDLGVKEKGVLNIALEFNGSLDVNQSYSDYTIVPTDETSGSIIIKMEQSGGGIAPLDMEEETSYAYYRVLYSNWTSTTIDILSLGQSPWDIETYEPVIDENGNFVPNREWNGLGISYQWTDPLPCQIASEVIPINYSSPDGTLCIWYDSNYKMYILDFGVTEPGKILEGYVDDETGMAYITRTLASDGYKVTALGFDFGEFTWTEGGVEYKIAYENYQPYQMVQLSSANEGIIATDNVTGMMMNIPNMYQIYPAGILPELYPMPTPEGAQWTFVPEMMPTTFCFDLGVTTEGVLTIAFDTVSMGAPAGTPYSPYNSLPYIVKPTDATSGNLVICTYNDDGELVETEMTITYSNLTDETCTFGGSLIETMFDESAECVIAAEPIVISGGGVAM